MADERKSSRHYDLNKTQKRNFNLEKDIDATPLPTGDSSKKYFWHKVVIPIVVVAVIAVLGILFWPKEDIVNSKHIAQKTSANVQNVDNQDNITASNNATSNPEENESQTAEQTTNEGSTSVEVVLETAKSVETTPRGTAVVRPTANNTPQPTDRQTKPASNATHSYHPSRSLTGNLEENARAVIRGEFGNGQERKAALGNNYQEIQDRVNEIYRERFNN